MGNRALLIDTAERIEERAHRAAHESHRAELRAEHLRDVAETERQCAAAYLDDKAAQYRAEALDEVAGEALRESHRLREIADELSDRTIAAWAVANEPAAEDEDEPDDELDPYTHDR